MNFLIVGKSIHSSVLITKVHCRLISVLCSCTTIALIWISSFSWAWNLCLQELLLVFPPLSTWQSQIFLKCNQVYHSDSSPFEGFHCLRMTSWVLGWLTDPSILSHYSTHHT